MLWLNRVKGKSRKRKLLTCGCKKLKEQTQKRPFFIRFEFLFYPIPCNYKMKTTYPCEKIFCKHRYILKDIYMYIKNGLLYYVQCCWKPRCVVQVLWYLLLAKNMLFQIVLKLNTGIFWYWSCDCLKYYLI